MTRSPTIALRRLAVLTAVLALGACDTGTPPYFGIAPQSAEVDGMTFDVRVKGLMAEALRTNMMWPPNERKIARGAALAMQQASGCEVLELRGDPSVIEGRLKCGTQEAPKFPKKRSSRLLLCSFERATTAEPKEIDDYNLICV